MNANLYQQTRECYNPSPMQKIRIKYSKEEELKYLSHLDIVRTIERAVRRSAIPISYTAGYNPRQQIAFGTPSNVGVTSGSEYLDIFLDRWTNPDIVRMELARTFPPGLKILDAKAFAPQGESLSSLINTAEYLVEIEGGKLEIDNLKLRIKEFFAQKEAKLIRKREKGDREIDIRPLVYRIELCSSNLLTLDPKPHSAILKLFVSVGNRGTVKPEELIRYLGNFAILKVRRVGLWIYRDKSYLSPI